MAAVVDYVPKNSFIHRLNPVSKIVWALTILIAAVMFNNFLYMLVLFGLVLMTAALAGVLTEISRLFKGLFLFAFILFLMQVGFYNGEDIYFYLLPIGKGYLGISKEGIVFSLAMAFRMLTIITSLLVFLATTKTQDLANTLIEMLHIPYDYSFMFLTAMRFIPTFLGEIRQISDAQRARGFVTEGWNPVKKIKAYVPLALPLVLISLKKAKQMALAMETRGYGAGHRTYLREPTINISDVMFISLMIITIAIFIFIKFSGYSMT